jgi:hypothetical protein
MGMIGQTLGRAVTPLFSSMVWGLSNRVQE